MRERAGAVAISFLLSLPLAAQSTTATLIGRASSNGVPVPNVTVTVSAPTLIGVRGTTTAADGHYVVPALPPGEYVVRFEGEGLETVAQRATLRLAETTRVDAELTLQTLRGGIVVRPAALSVLETPQVGTNISGETMELLPAGRGIVDALRLAPGTTVDAGRSFISVNGAEVFDNLYMVNGVTVGSRSENQPLNLFIEDAIQETSILTSGISAEYGRFTGGVVNVLTKSGGNELSGSLRDTLSSDRWTAATPYAAEPEHLDEINQEVQGTLGGRIVRDRLWFFLSGRLFERDRRLATAVTLEPYTHTNYENRSEAKLTAAVARNQTFVGSYLRVGAHQRNRNRTADLRALNTDHFPHSLLALHYTAVAGASLVAEAQYSYKQESHNFSGAADTTEVGGLPVFDAYSGTEFWAPLSCDSCGSGYGNAREYLLKGSWFRPTARLGTHELVFGYDEYHDLMRSTFRLGTSDLVLTAPVDMSTGQPVLQLIPELTYVEYARYAPTQEADFTARAFFVNDRVSLGRHLTASLGLRHDHNHAVNLDDRVVTDDARFSPRVGLVYDLAGNGRDRVNASFGRYVAKTHESATNSIEAATSPTTFAWEYTGPEINADPSGEVLPTEEVIRQFLAWFEARGGKTDLTDAILSYSPADALEETLDSPYADEIAVGYAHAFGNRGVVQLNLVRRQWSSFYALHVSTETGTVTTPDGSVVDRVVLDTEEAGLEREYRGAQLQTRFEVGRLSLSGNYTYSTLRGNVDGSSSGIPAASPSIVDYYREYTNYPRYAPVGYLSGDIRHVANAWAIYRFPGQRHRFTASLLQRYHSGRPYNMTTIVDTRDSTQNPGYAFVPFMPYYFAPRGSLRMDDVTETGIGLHYSLQVGALELLAHGNVVNVFNEQALANPFGIVTTVNAAPRDRNLAKFDPRTQTPVECPQGVRSSSAECRGIAHFQKVAAFGTPRAAGAYQQPRTYSLSLAVRF
ncbi:MAG TPA: carboxypeptidase regulatory-like domain-containing protein [Thermoanaerobaculia bacterium]|jgi:hypothetical protein